MNVEEWEATVPAEIKGDALWTVKAYRLALLAADLACRDASTLLRDRRMWSLTDQLYRAVGSIGANIAEGYSRGSAKDRCRFYEYALGSGRESRDWYYKGRAALPEAVFIHRLRLLTDIIRLLLVMIPDQRGHAVHEDVSAYYADSCSPAPSDADSNRREMQTLSADIPEAGD